MNKFLVFIICLLFNTVLAQDVFHIKSFQFLGNKEAIVPIYNLGENVSFSFDDLIGDEANYDYKVIHCNRNWEPSSLTITEFMEGMELNRIRTLRNSYNSLQSYTNYRSSFSESRLRLLKSGNYILEILNENGEVVLKRKFIMSENSVTVALEPRRLRDLSKAVSKQNIYAIIDSGSMLLHNPTETVKLHLMQNGQFFNVIKDIKPQYILGNQLRFQYDDETSFWGGNEFLFFENNDLRMVTSTVAKVEMNDLYESFLYPDYPKYDKKYSFFPDVNGSFYPNIRNKPATTFPHEADYAWVHFSLNSSKLESDVFVGGMFNDYQFTPENKMTYNEENGRYELSLLLKQGYYNYQYYIVNNGRTDLENSINGNYLETENMYYGIVYYKGQLDRYDRVLGVGKIQAINITN